MKFPVFFEINFRYVLGSQYKTLLHKLLPDAKITWEFMNSFDATQLDPRYTV